MKSLRKTEFGDPVLRTKARKLTVPEIKSAKIQILIKDIHHSLLIKKFGVGLAAPQVGHDIALAIVAIRPTSNRPKATKFDLVMFNPVLLAKSGKKSLWEGCLSAGKESMFAKVPRYTKITVSFLDEKGKRQVRELNGLPAHVVQHEIDHLNGILFVDRVEDTKTYMSLSEYKKRVVAKRKGATVSED